MTNYKPLVSILCPVYGVENYIGECLDTLFNQTYDNLEYIFVNDNTPDKSMVILNQYISEKNVSEKVTIINNDKNIGLAGVRIECIKAAKGDYITIVDTDDKLSLDAITRFVECALLYNADIVESDYYLFDQKGIKEHRREQFDSKDSQICSQLSLKSPVALWGKLYRRSLFDDVDNLFIVGSKNIEDYYATPKLYEKANVVTHLENFTYYYRTDNNNSGSRNRKWDKIESLNIAIKSHEDFFSFKKSECYKKALFEVKYYVVRTNYAWMKYEDSTKLSKMYPEIETFMKGKSFSERLIWSIIRHNKYQLFMLLIRIKRFLFATKYSEV